jgi:uncharacterized protein (TIGR02145 family)
MALLCLILQATSFAQSIKLNNEGDPGSAMLEVNSASKGILIPNVALTGITDATTIKSPALSLLVYNTATVNDVEPGYYYNAGTIVSPIWARLATDATIGTITSLQIKNGTIVDEDIADETITSLQIKNGTIVDEDIADETITSLQIKNGTIVDEDIAVGISASKIADGKVSNHEFQYLDSLTSNIQAQLNVKAELISPSFSGIPLSPTGNDTLNNDQIATTAFVKTVLSKHKLDSTGITALGFVAGGGLPSIVGKNIGDVLMLADSTLEWTSPPMANDSTSGFLSSTVYKAFLGSLNNMDTTIGDKIPYSGADRNVDLGNFELKVQGLTIGLGGGAITTNTAFGVEALLFNDAGQGNVAVGDNAGKYITSANFNTMIGMGAGTGIATGSGNVVIGSYAAQNNSNGHENTIIGANADVKPNSNIENSTSLGSHAYVGTNNTIQLGNTAITNVNTSGAITTTKSITGSSFIKLGGTASQFLKADGSVDSTTKAYVDLLKAEVEALKGVKDIDNNRYDIITIGTQTWMAENLKTTRYNDGTVIPVITDGTAWVNAQTTTSPAYCWYNAPNETTNLTTYGALYNWYAINTSTNGNKNVCPTGWHVPTDGEWTTLTDALGGESVAGGKMKEAGLAHWASPNTGATNESGFAGLPGGFRFSFGSFSFIGGYGYWWSSTEYNTTNAWGRGLDYSVGYVDRYNVKFGKGSGFSVRCLRD